ncbi:MAG: M48 family metallopeptidase [Proteobacteria bacterium]|nr:M48 family metallopeptidase [Pseudomonadota bacterium]
MLHHSYRKNVPDTYLPCLKRLWLGLLLMALAPLSIADSDLPNIGDSASTELSQAKEIELGRVLLTEIRRGLPVSNDPELVQYVQALGTRIVSGSLESNFPFTFLLVENPSINAFAMPGGIIAINSGLLTLTTQESELASVIAHEIAHVTQRHIARNLENAKSFNVVSALTFLGAILASIYNVDLGQAALMTSQAGLQQATLAYSRAFEQEADRIGMQLMVSAGIDPYGMPQFFKRMHKYTQLNHGKLPEFLRTHPLTLARITESEARARQYRGSYAFNSIDYNYARARTLALSTPHTELIEHYRAKGRTPGGLSDVEHYTYALALSRAGRHEQGLRHLEEITVNADNRLTVRLADAQIRLAMGQTATDALEALDRIYPGSLPVTYYLAMSLIKEDRAQRALEKLDQLSRVQVQNPLIDKMTAKAASKAQMPWRSHESLGNFYAAHGQYDIAMEQVQLALQSPGIDASSKARIEARGIQLRQLEQQREQFK